MTRFADIPVQRKLGIAMLFTSSFALVVACSVFLAVQYQNYRWNLMRTVATLAQVTADNSTAALAFSDPAAARQTLEALHADPQIVAAALYRENGQIIAQYLPGADSVIPRAVPALSETHFEDGHAVVVQSVVENGRRLGTLFLSASQEIMFARMRTTAWVALAILTLSIVSAAILAERLGRTLAGPILELDRTASAVTAGQDYSLRAMQYGDDELGRLTMAFNAMMERTQRSVDALRESEQRFRNLADHAPVLIWLADPCGRAVWVNQQWLGFTGRTLEAERGMGWWERVHPDDRAAIQQALDGALGQQAEFQFEYRLQRQDGTYRWMLNRGLPWRDAAGKITGLIGSAIDVSDRKQAEQAIAEARDRALAASRAKDNFLAALSHELRTPLTPVLLLATEEAANPRLAPDVRADFEMIAKNVALEARLIDDLLDLTRITRGKLVLERRRADAHAVLQDALANVSPDFAAKSIELEVELSAPEHHLLADTVRLQQVFWNVLKNAAKFTPEKGRVNVETSVVDRDRLLVRVVDSGLGMTGAELGRIFDAFAQGDHAGTPALHRFGGLGLGLAISQRLIELHGGTICAKSAGRDLGSTLEIELPLERSPGGASAAGQPDALEGRIFSPPR